MTRFISTTEMVFNIVSVKETETALIFLIFSIFHTQFTSWFSESLGLNYFSHKHEGNIRPVTLFSIQIFSIAFVFTSFATCCAGFVVTPFCVINLGNNLAKVSFRNVSNQRLSNSWSSWLSSTWAEYKLSYKHLASNHSSNMMTEKRQLIALNCSSWWGIPNYPMSLGVNQKANGRHPPPGSLVIINYFKEDSLFQTSHRWRTKYTAVCLTASAANRCAEYPRCLSSSEWFIDLTPSYRELRITWIILLLMGWTVWSQGRDGVP